MRVDGIERFERGDRVILRARLRSRFGEDHVAIDVPAPMAGRDHDATHLVPIALMPALIAGEGLHVDGPVDAGVVHAAHAVSEMLARWDPTLRAPAITAAEIRDPRPAPPPGGPVGCFFSRGVDSMYEASLADRSPAPLTHLVYVDGLEPRHGPEVRAAEIDLAGRASAALGLELVVVHTDVRELTNDRRDWADVNGTAFAGIALAMGAFDRAVIPSTNGVDSMVPYGSHPLLETRLGSTTTAIEHGDVRFGRLGKVLALARDRPDLLAYLKVCFDEDRPDNCGRCGKCLNTMSCLVAVDALHLAHGFPDDVDVEAVRALRPSPLQSRLHWLEVARALSDDGSAGELRAAIQEALRRSVRPPLVSRVRNTVEHLVGVRPLAHPLWRPPTRGFDSIFHNDVLGLLTSGRSPRPYGPVGELPAPPPLRPAAA